METVLHLHLQETYQGEIYPENIHLFNDMIVKLSGFGNLTKLRSTLNNYTKEDPCFTNIERNTFINQDRYQLKLIAEMLIHQI